MSAKSKKIIHRLLIDHVQAELDAITDAAKKSFATATSDEHRAESKYDTFKLESSFLSRGLAKRVEELTTALESLQGLDLKKLNKHTPVQVSALIRLKSDDGKTLAIFLGPDAGGESIRVDGEEISIVSARSPLGIAVLNKLVGDTFELTTGKATTRFTVLSVA